MFACVKPVRAVPPSLCFYNIDEMRNTIFVFVSGRVRTGQGICQNGQEPLSKHVQALELPAAFPTSLDYQRHFRQVCGHVRCHCRQHPARSIVRESAVAVVLLSREEPEDPKVLQACDMRRGSNEWGSATGRATKRALVTAGDGRHDHQPAWSRETPTHDLQCRRHIVRFAKGMW